MHTRLKFPEASAIAADAGLPQTAGSLIAEATTINPDKASFILNGTADPDEKLAYLKNMVTEAAVEKGAAVVQVKEAEKIAFNSNFMSENEVWNSVHENPNFVKDMTGLTNTGYIDYLENIYNSKASSQSEKLAANDMLNKLSKAGIHWVKGG